MASIEFTAFPRVGEGRGASRRLRHAGKAPGVVYGAGANPTPIELDHNALIHALKKEAFHSSILDMELNGHVQKVLLRDFQMHPWKQIVLHVDFQRVDNTTKITKKVPLHFVNEENSPAVKTDKCLVSHVVNEIEISCLAAELPELLEVDLGEVVKGQSLHASDIKLPKGVKIVTHGKKDPVIAAVTEPKAVEEEVIVAPVVIAAPETKAKPKKTEKQNKK